MWAMDKNNRHDIKKGNEKKQQKNTFNVINNMNQKEIVSRLQSL